MSRTGPRLRPLLTTSLTLASAAAVFLAGHAAGTSGYHLTRASAASEARQVVRWNPCDPPITYRVNVAAYKTVAQRNAAISSTKAAVAWWAKASGLRFTYQGTTSFIAQPNNWQNQPAKMVIGFVRPAQTKHSLVGNVIGVGGYAYEYRFLGEGKWASWVTKGYVVIDEPGTRAMKRSNTQSGTTLTNVIAHEIGHVLGLGHTSDHRQTMYPSISASTPAGLGAGDKAAAKRAGKSAGCA